jgi:hypothetical protein
MNLTPVKYPSILTPIGIQALDDYEAGDQSGTWGVDEVRCNRTYSNKLKVFVTSPVSGPCIGPAQILMNLPCRIGDPYQFPLLSASPTENDTGSFLQSIKVEKVSEDGRQWSAVLEYGPFDVQHQLGVSDISQGIINPLDRYPEVYWARAKYEHYKPYDETPASDGGPLPYVNTVGDPLLNPPPTEETRPTLKFIRNESTYNDSYAGQYKDTVNSDEFLGYPPNTAKCSDIGGERNYDADWGYYFRVTYELEFRDDDDGKGYTKEIANMGYKQLVNGTGSPQTIIDPSTGAAFTDACPLQENGAYVAGQPVYYIPFQEFPAIPFEDLNIPPDVLDQNE